MCRLWKRSQRFVTKPTKRFQFRTGGLQASLSLERVIDPSKTVPYSVQQCVLKCKSQGIVQNVRNRNVDQSLDWTKYIHPMNLLTGFCSVTITDYCKLVQKQGILSILCTADSLLCFIVLVMCLGNNRLSSKANLQDIVLLSLVVLLKVRKSL